MPGAKTVKKEDAGHNLPPLAARGCQVIHSNLPSVVSEWHFWRTTAPSGGPVEKNNVFLSGAVVFAIVKNAVRHASSWVAELSRGPRHHSLSWENRTVGHQRIG